MKRNSHKCSSRQLPLRITAAVSLLIFSPASVIAAPTPANSDGTGQPWPVALRAVLQKAADVQWRLHTAAAVVCQPERSEIGVVFDSLDAYEAADRAAVASALAMSQMPQIAAVARGGPADRAGLSPGDNVLEIAGVPASAINDGQHNQTFADQLDSFVAQLPANRSIDFRIVDRNGQQRIVPVTPESRCSARLIVTTDRGIDAYSDARNVALTAGLIAATRNDDEIALVAGHELAHVIAGDAATENSIARSRQIEDRADSVGYDLAFCAGYDPVLAMNFWKRIAKRDLLRWFRLPTHRSFPARIAQLSARTAPETCPLPRTAVTDFTALLSR